MNMPQIDDVIAERYLIESKLGQGGMGVVFGVRHQGIDRQYAMKVLTPRLSMDEDYRTRFIREAKINARLSHPNVVQVYDSGTHDGLLYIVMEHLRGEALSEMLWDNKVGGLLQVIKIGEQISAALNAAHEIGLIHRDLKTDNVLVEEDEETGKRRCVLLDFGLAYIEESGDLGRLTRDSNHSVAGTPLYMSPEQISAAPLSASTDIYSLGCMMYELLTGKTPFEGEDMSIIKVMSRHMFMTPTSLRSVLPDIPLALEEFVMSMLAKDPLLRPVAASCERFFREIEHLPSTGRGGVLQQRSERQLQEETARDGRQLTTARFYAQSSTRSENRQIGLWGLQISEDHQLSLASSGFELVDVDGLEDLAELDMLLVGLIPIEDVNTLTQHCEVVVFVDASALDHAADYLRAGVVDVIPHNASLAALNKRLERVYKRVLRARKRQHIREQ